MRRLILHRETIKNKVGYMTKKIAIISRVKRCLLYIMPLSLLFSCSVSYKFDGGSIDYNLIKTVQLREFQNQAPLVYPLLTQMFNQQLRNRFVEQTRLREVSNSGDLYFEGEITGYDVVGMAVKEDAFASMTRLSITVKVRYTNNKKPEESIDQSFQAFREFSSSRSLDEVQDNLIREIVGDLVDEIYNATLGNW